MLALKIVEELVSIDAFKLYDTYGSPGFDQGCLAESLAVDEDGFNQEMEKRGRAVRPEKEPDSTTGRNFTESPEKFELEFTGYEHIDEKKAI